MAMDVIRFAQNEDEGFWYSLDNHLRREEFFRKVRDRRAFVISEKDEPVGILRYNLFWDEVPFLTMIHLEERYRRKGLGKNAILSWETEMRKLGFSMVMTSTQIDEEAQHFYRKLGYVEKGSLVFDNTPLSQPMEVVLMKVL